MISDTKRDLFYTRPSPDGTRILFGSRPGIFEVSDERQPRLARQDVRGLAAACRAKDHACLERLCRHDLRQDRRIWANVTASIHAVGCNGNGVALMTYLGHQSALKLLGRQNRPALSTGCLPVPSALRGKAWFLPIVSGWYRIRDRMETAAGSGGKQP